MSIRNEVSMTRTEAHVSLLPTPRLSNTRTCQPGNAAKYLSLLARHPMRQRKAILEEWRRNAPTDLLDPAKTARVQAHDEGDPMLDVCRSPMNFVVQVVGRWRACFEDTHSQTSSHSQFRIEVLKTHSHGSVQTWQSPLRKQVSGANTAE